MKYLSIIAIVVLLVCFFLPKTPERVGAATLSSEYRALVRKNQKLEKKRADLEIEIRTLSKQKRRLSFQLFRCVAGKNSDTWNKKLKSSQALSESLEKQRHELSGLRKKLENIRVELEKERFTIEKEHTFKGEDYEKAFRKYMENFENLYLKRLEDELLAGYQSYMNEIGSCLTTLLKMIGECKRSS
jgi:Skp family chaperone for outer membrane proteins